LHLPSRILHTNLGRGVSVSIPSKGVLGFYPPPPGGFLVKWGLGVGLVGCVGFEVLFMKLFVSGEGFDTVDAE
jgi:hypothetical protein